MHTPAERELVQSTRDSLEAVLAIWPKRWSVYTRAAARELSNGDVVTIHPSAWVGILEAIETRLAPIASKILSTT